MDFERTEKAFAGRIRKIAKQVTEADLTAGALTQTIAVGNVIGYVMGVRVKVATAFTGGGTSDCKVAVGDANDDDALLASADIDAAVDGEASTYTGGAAPRKYYASQTLVSAKFTAVGANVTAFTAGDCTIEVLYTNPKG